MKLMTLITFLFTVARADSCMDYEVIGIPADEADPPEDAEKLVCLPSTCYEQWELTRAQVQLLQDCYVDPTTGDWYPNLPLVDDGKPDTPWDVKDCDPVNPDCTITMSVPTTVTMTNLCRCDNPFGDCVCVDKGEVSLTEACDACCVWRENALDDEFVQENIMSDLFQADCGGFDSQWSFVAHCFQDPQPTCAWDGSCADGEADLIINDQYLANWDPIDSVMRVDDIVSFLDIDFAGSKYDTYMALDGRVSMVGTRKQPKIEIVLIPVLNPEYTGWTYTFTLPVNVVGDRFYIEPGTGVGLKEVDGKIVDKALVHLRNSLYGSVDEDAGTWQITYNYSRLYKAEGLLAGTLWAPIDAVSMPEEAE